LAHAFAGNGTLPHVTMALLLQRLGLRLTHVPYKGAALAIAGLLRDSASGSRSAGSLYQRLAQT
jgi:tripartite-type tricarboxylate transporter receptor subunit TctC